MGGYGGGLGPPGQWLIFHPGDRVICDGDGFAAGMRGTVEATAHDGATLYVRFDGDEGAVACWAGGFLPAADVEEMDAMAITTRDRDLDTPVPMHESITPQVAATARVAVALDEAAAQTQVSGMAANEVIEALTIALTRHGHGHAPLLD